VEIVIVTVLVIRRRIQMIMVLAAGIMTLGILAIILGIHHQIVLIFIIQYIMIVKFVVLHVLHHQHGEI